MTVFICLAPFKAQFLCSNLLDMVLINTIAVKETIQFQSDGSRSGHMAMNWTHNRIKDRISKPSKSDWKDCTVCVHTMLWKMRSVSHIDQINWILGCQILWTCIPSQYDPIFWSFTSLHPPLIGCGFPPSPSFALLVRNCLHFGNCSTGFGVCEVWWWG